jgi:hypothetical protein
MTRPATWGPSPRTASGTCASPDATCPPTPQVESGLATSASWRHRLGRRWPEAYVQMAANQPHVTCIFCIVVTIVVEAIHSFRRKIQSITCQASGRSGATTPLLHEGATREAVAPPPLLGTTCAVHRCSRQGAPVSAPYLHEKYNYPKTYSYKQLKILKTIQNIITLRNISKNY